MYIELILLPAVYMAYVCVCGGGGGARGGVLNSGSMYIRVLLSSKTDLNIDG